MKMKFKDLTPSDISAILDSFLTEKYNSVPRIAALNNVSYYIAAKVINEYLENKQRMVSQKKVENLSSIE